MVTGGLCESSLGYFTWRESTKVCRCCTNVERRKKDDVNNDSVLHYVNTYTDAKLILGGKRIKAGSNNLVLSSGVTQDVCEKEVRSDSRC